jgi:hypothetical protein
MALYYWDLECCAIPNAADFLEPVKAPGNIKDPVKIAAAIAEKEADRLEKLALDPYLCRIVAIGEQSGGLDVEAYTLRDEQDERGAIEALFCEWSENDVWKPCGYYSRGYDHLVINARARLLGVAIPSRLLTISKYPNSRDWFVDLYDLFNDDSERIMRRGLVSMCKRFGIDLPDDDIKGGDVAKAFAEGRMGEIEAHVALDVLRTRALAEKLGVE